MKLETIKNKTDKLLLFDKKSLKMLEKDDNALNSNIKYWLKNSDLIALKKGIYIFKERYNQESKKDDYLEYIANQLIQPSYVSLEYVMAKYQLLSEPARAITSITVKNPREFYNSLGVWRYYSLPIKLFVGYKIKYFQGQPIAEATKAKAVFDFLYLRFRRGVKANRQNIDDLRLNWENLNKQDLKELNSYFELIGQKRYEYFKKLITEYVN
ncbi:MAG: hypothetical protein V1732_03825 [Patescibacteria group bacterium]|nr:hypothetical protein [Patescibacteria group bacterium]MBU4141760.1 hypothetical protein [Patescibacteria group bacterium]